MKAATTYRLIIVLIIASTLLFGYALLPTQVRALGAVAAGDFSTLARIW